MTTMTPEARMELASERLNAWLEEFAKMEETDCIDCLKGAVAGISEAYELVWKLWTERA